MRTKGKNKTGNRKNTPIVESLSDRVLYSADPLGLSSELVSSEESKYFDDDISMISGDSPSAITETHLVFVDTSVNNHQQIIDSISNGSSTLKTFIVHTIDHSDSVNEVTEVIQSHTDLAAVHFITHGTDSSIRLGQSTINTESIHLLKDDLESWAESITAEGDILFYGCNLAATEDGKLLIDQIATATQADVAASDNLTGHTNYSADWLLEYSTGDVGDNHSAFENILDEWESVLPSVINVDTPADTVNGDISSTSALIANPGGDGISLREAVLAANAENAQPDEITIQLTTDTYTLDPAYGKLNLTASMNIQGPGTGTATIDAQDNHRVFDIQHTRHVELSNLHIENGAAWGESGGGIFIQHVTLDMNNVTLHSNTAEQLGGGLFIGPGSTVLMNDVNFTSNTAYLEGGGLYQSQDTMVQGVETVFSGNKALDPFNPGIARGGAIFTYSASLNLYLSTLKDNQSDNGGAIAQTVGGAIRIEDSTITDNIATYDGGGIRIENGNVHIERTLIHENFAKDGAGIAQLAGTSFIYNSTISNNEASEYGGGVKLLSGDSNIFRATIAENSAGLGGDALHQDPATGIRVGSSIIVDDDHTGGPNSSNGISSNVESGGYNLTDASFDDPKTTDRSGEADFASPVEPAINGGYTGTYALEPSGDAIDNGAPPIINPIVDQTGALRDSNNDNDIGAYEYRPPGTIYAPTLVTNKDLDIAIGESSFIGRGHLLALDPDINNDVTYTITQIPSSGTLYLDGIPLVVSDTFTQTEIDTGKLTYTNTGTSSSDSFEFAAFDGTGTDRVFNINVSSDAPVLGTIEAAPAKHNENTPTGITGNLNITDDDSAYLQSAVVTISNGFNATEDELLFANTGNITGNYDQANGILTLTGIASTFDYTAALHSVQYNNTSDTPDTATREITFEVSDGTNNSNQISRDIDIIRVNDAPSITNLTTNPGYTQGTGPTPIAPNAVISDPELDLRNGGNGNYNDAVLTIGRSDPDDRFYLDDTELTGTGDIDSTDDEKLAAYTVSSGNLTLTFTDEDGLIPTSHIVSGILNSIRYSNAVAAPDTATLDITINDSYTVPSGSGGAQSSTAEVTFDITNPPDFTHSHPAQIITDEDVAYTFDGANGIPTVQIQDDSGKDYQLRVQLDVTNGTISLPNTNNLDLVIQPINPNSIVVEGLRSDINTALQELEYTPSANHNNNSMGGDTLKIHSSATVDREGFYTFSDPAPIDSSGASNDGTLVGDAHKTATHSVLRLDGDNDALHIPSDFGLTTTGELTFSTWVAINPNSNTNGLFSIDGSVGLYYNADTAENKNTLIAGYRYGSGPDYNTIHTSVDLTELDTDGKPVWHHIAYTIDTNNNQQTIYIDGTAVSTSYPTEAIQFTNPSPTTSVGALTSIGDLSLNGLMDDVEFFSRALSKEEIEYLYAYRPNDKIDVINDIDINIHPVNDEPTLATIDTLPVFYTEDSPPVGLTGNLNVDDIDNVNLQSATITIGTNHMTDEDSLLVDNALLPAGITASYNAANGIMTLTGSAAVADYETAIKLVSYHNTSDTPSNLTRTIDVTVSDGDLDSKVLSRDLQIQPVNDAPNLTTTTPTSLVYTENDGEVVINDSLTVHDPDSIIESATVTLQNATAQDRLNYTGSGGPISAAYDSATGVLSLTGSATPAEYQAALRLITFENPSEEPSAVNRTVEYKVNDGQFSSNVLNQVINVYSINDAPILDSIETAPVSYTENTLQTITNSLSIIDVDHTDIQEATIIIGLNFVSTEDTLIFNDAPFAGITSSYDATNGVLSLIGNAPITVYESAIRSVQYENISENPSTLTRTIEITVNDGFDVSNVSTRDIEIVRLNDAPLTNNVSVTTNEDTPVVIPFTDFAFSDASDANHNLADVIVDTTNPRLSVDNIAQTVTYTPATNFNGSDSFAFQVKDDGGTDNGGSDTSVPATMTVSVTSVNDAPGLNSIELANAIYVENQPPTGITGNLNINDDDDLNLQSATISITNNHNPAQDSLLVDNTLLPASIVSNFNATDGILTLTGSATIADYQAAIRSVAYHNNSDSPTTGARTISFLVNDGFTDSNVLARNISIIALNDAPAIADAQLPPVNEDNVLSNPPTILQLIGTGTDVDSSLDSIFGIAVTENAASATEGTWQYSPDGFSWFNINPVSDTAALVLDKDTQIKFDPEPNFHGTPQDLKVRPLDHIYTGIAATSNSATDRIPLDTTTLGNNLVGAPQSISTVVSSVNDAPVAASTILTAIPEDTINPTGESIGTLIAAATDVDTALDPAHTQIGIAITENNESALNGSWQYLDTSGNWQDIGTVSKANALLLETTSSLRFMPQPDYHGIPLSLKAHVVDSSHSGSGPYANTLLTGGTTAFSNQINISTSVTATNDAPVLSTIEALPAQFIENSTAIEITGNLTLSDIDDTNVESAVVSISNNFTAGEDELVFTDQLGISGFYNSSTGAMTLTGSSSIANYETAIRSIGYQNTSDNPSVADRTVTVVINDGDENSSPKTRDIIVTTINDAPVVANLESSPLVFREGNAPLITTTDIFIADIDGPIQSATVAISQNYVVGEDELAANNASLNTLYGINATFDVSSGKMILSGTASAADYQLAIGSIAYTNNSENPSGLTRTISYTVNDGTTDSNIKTRSLEIQPVNDEPLGANTTISVLEDAQHIFEVADFGFSDPRDSNAFSGITIKSLPVNGTLLLGVSTASNNAWVSLAQINNGDLKYIPDTNNTNQDSWEFVVSDDGGTAYSGIDQDQSKNNITINMLPANDSPGTSDVDLIAIPEDTTTPNGQLISTLINPVFSDIDNGDTLAGIAITAYPSPANGIWQYQTNSGSWQDVNNSTLTETNALFLDKDTSIAFLPDSNYHGTPKPLEYKAIDSDYAGAFTTDTLPVEEDTTTGGGNAPFSNVAQITAHVNPVNDAPIIANAQLTPIIEDTVPSDANSTTPMQIQDLFAAQYDDVDGTAAISGIAVTDNPANATEGRWQYSTNSVDWHNVNPVNDTLALLLKQDAYIRFAPAANFHGDPADLSIRAVDGTFTGSFSTDNTNRELMNTTTAGSMVSDEHAISISVKPVNDEPQGSDTTVAVFEDTQHTFTVAEFGFSDPIDLHAFFGITVKSLPDSGTLLLGNTPVSNNSWVSLADLTAGNLKYAPDTNSNVQDSWNFVVSDNGGTVNNGIDQDQSSNTVTIDITPINDAPAGANNSIQSIGGIPVTLGAANFGFSDFIDSHSFESIVVDTVPQAGALLLNNMPVSNGQQITAIEIDAGSLAYTAPIGDALDQNTMTFSVVDTGGTANGGQNTAANSNTLLFTVTPPPNTPPQSVDTNISLREDTVHTFNAADFSFSDPTDGHGFQSVLLVTTPPTGSLSLNNTEVFAGDVISSSEIGNLTFTPEPSGFGQAYSAFDYKVIDTGTIIGGGSNTSATNTITFDVTSVNDAPSASDNMLQVVETESYTFKLVDFGFSDPMDQHSLESITISNVPATGTLQLGQTIITAGTTIAATDIANSQFTYEAPTVEVAESDLFSFIVTDNGGTANGGTDTATSTNTITLSITASNTRPTGADATLTVDEDGNLPLTDDVFGYSDADGHQMAGVIITSLPTAGTLTLSDVPVQANDYIPASRLIAGELTFAPIPDTFGDNYTSLDFLVLDTGGMQTGKHIAGSESSLNITVLARNDAPENLSLTGDLQIDENTTETNIATVNFTDADTDDSHQISVSDNRFEIVNGQLALKAGITIDHENEDVIPLQVTVTDSAGASTSQEFILQIADVNEAPVVTQPIQSQAGTESFQFTVPTNIFFDTDNDPLSLSASLTDGSELPSWLEFEPATGIFTATDAAGESASIMLTATDPDGLSASTIFELNVEPPTAAAVEALPVVEPVVPAVVPQPEVNTEEPAEETSKPEDKPEEKAKAEQRPDSSENDNLDDAFAAGLAAAGITLSPDDQLSEVVQFDGSAKKAGSTIDLKSKFTLDVKNHNDFQLKTSQWGSTLTVAQQQLAEFNALSLKNLSEQVDSTKSEMTSAQVLETSVIATSVTLSSSLSVGYILWLLRGGTLLASMMASLPAWKAIDPLPILNSLDGDDENDTETLESMVDSDETETEDQKDKT